MKLFDVLYRNNLGGTRGWLFTRNGVATHLDHFACYHFITGQLDGDVCSLIREQHRGSRNNRATGE
jgi:hypothetical protein